MTIMEEILDRRVLAGHVITKRHEIEIYEFNMLYEMQDGIYRIFLTER